MNPIPLTTSSPLTAADIARAVEAIEPETIELLGRLVAAASLSGHETPAAEVLEAAMAELGLASERLVMRSVSLAALPLYSPPCCDDAGRYNLLAFHDGSATGRSVLFNGHLDVVPTGPEALWRHPPYSPVVEDGWLHGRGSGDMKGGIVCALAAFKALRTLGVQPAGRVGFNWVLEEECTGNGALASVVALRALMARERLAAFDAVVIPEPLGECLISAQVGVFWMQVALTGRPAHAAMMDRGVNPIDAAFAVMADLRLLEAEWNLPENRHPSFRDHAHPINFNLGRIEGGEWTSSVPCTCTMGVRIGFFPDTEVADAKACVAAVVQATVARLGSGLSVAITYDGFHAPGAVFDLDGPALQVLAESHQRINGWKAPHEATTATTDARHFHLMLDAPVTCYGPLARNIHGIDEAVSLDSMRRVTTTLALFIHDWCGVEPARD